MMNSGHSYNQNTCDFCSEKLSAEHDALLLAVEDYIGSREVYDFYSDVYFCSFQRTIKKNWGVVSHKHRLSRPVASNFGMWA